MTSFLEDSVRCYCCAKPSQQSILLSSNEFGSRDLDQRPAEVMRSTMVSWLQECPNCGYVAAALPEGDERDRLFVRTHNYIALCEVPQVSRLSSRFLRRVAIDAARDDFGQAFSNTLCAAWDADDHDLDDVARSLRKTASGYLAGRSVESIDLQLRLLDVLRRAADWAGAAALAWQMMSQRLDRPCAAIVRFQLGRINSNDDRCYTVSDALAADRNRARA